MVDLAELIKSLQASKTRFVRVLWCDNANVIRAKAIHIGALEHHQHGVGISAAQQAVPVMFDSPAIDSGLGPVGEIRLMPDWSSLQPLSYAPGHVRVMGDMIRDGEPWTVCPRNFLRRMVAAANQQGITVKAAFENEFYLVQPDVEGLLPSDRTVFASTLAMDVQQIVIDAIVDALLAQDIAIEQYYPESGPGQHEISVRYAPAMQTADQQIAFRETVRAIAHQHNLVASFLPKIFAESAGCGCHIHFSLWAGDTNLLSDSNNPYGLSDLAQQFAAGLLHHLPALMALTTPTPNSYRRLLPHCWSGAFRCWGIDNREAALRIPSNPAGPGVTHIELKTVDASSNPYLALGALIAAGLDGIRQKSTLTAPVITDPGYLSEPERRERRIDRLPTTLEASLSHLENTPILLAALGPDLAKAYLAVRKTECEALRKLELTEEVNLLLERY